MAILKANKDKARFVSNPISQDALDGDWVDHEVITKYKLPEIVIDASTSTVYPNKDGIVSPTEITTGAKLKVLDGASIVDRTAGTVTTVATDLLTSTNPFGDNSQIGKYLLDNSLLGLIGDPCTSLSPAYSAGIFGNGYSAPSVYKNTTSEALRLPDSLLIDGATKSFGFFWKPYDTNSSTVDIQLYKGLSVTIRTSSNLFVTSFGTSTITASAIWYYIYFDVTPSGGKIRIYNTSGTLLEEMATASNLTSGAGVGSTFGGSSSASYKIDIDMIDVFNRVLTTEEQGYLIKQVGVKYQAPITATTNIPTKAYFNKTIDTTLSAEVTSKCKSSTITQIGVL